MGAIKLSWSGNAVENLSALPKSTVQLLIMQAQISQAKIANAARAGHDASAHGNNRYVSQTGNLTQSIIPGPVTVTDDGVEFSVLAQASYAGYVEGEPSMKSTAKGVYPFLNPAALDEVPFFLARLRLGLEALKLS